MEMTDSFEVARPIDEAWEVLKDVERIAPCLPGAQLQEIEGDEYRGVVKVKLGAITAQFKGAAVFEEQDDERRRFVLRGKGRGTQGNAEALITASMEALSDSTTQVNVDTDLKITGKVAQMGRGIIPEVSSKLMGQFAENLAELLESDLGAESESEPTPADTAELVDEAPDPEPFADASGPRKVDMPEPEAVDLLDAAGTPILKRLVPMVALIVAVLVVRRLLRKR